MLNITSLYIKVKLYILCTVSVLCLTPPIKVNYDTLWAVYSKLNKYWVLIKKSGEGSSKTATYQAGVRPGGSCCSRDGELKPMLDVRWRPPVIFLKVKSHTLWAVYCVSTREINEGRGVPTTDHQSSPHGHEGHDGKGGITSRGINGTFQIINNDQ